MPGPLLTPELIGALQASFPNRTRYTAADGRVNVLGAILPGKAVCTAAVIDDNLWVVIDWDKYCAVGHTRAMLRESGVELMTGVIDPMLGTEFEVNTCPDPGPDDQVVLEMERVKAPVE